MQRHSDSFYNRQYERYLKQYNKIQEQQRRYGLSMADPKYTKEQFKIWYDNVSVDVDVQKKKKSISSILANRQAWEMDFSRKQRIRLRQFASKALNEAIESGDPSKSALGNPALIKKYYEQLVAEGYTGTETSKIISNVIFGSP